MSTRGAVAWGNLEKWQALYSHYDSYPEGLGADVWKLLKEMGGPRNFVEEISKYTNWSDFLNLGRCPYCGQFAQVENVNGHLTYFDKNGIYRTRGPDYVPEWSRRAMEERTNPHEVMKIQKEERGDLWNKSSWVNTGLGHHDVGFRDESLSALLIAYQYKDTGYPDPFLLHHSHREEENRKPRMNQDTTDRLFVEWVYIVDVESDVIHVLASCRIGAVRHGLKQVGNPNAGLNSDYSYWLMDTVKLSEEEWPGSLIKYPYPEED